MPLYFYENILLVHTVNDKSYAGETFCGFCRLLQTMKVFHQLRWCFLHIFIERGTWPVTNESSQHKNRAAALKVLRSRLLADQKEKAAAERAAERKSLVSTGDRSAKIRTYNFPQGRVTDHRINFTSYRLSEIMNGDIEEIIEKLKIAEQQDILSAEIN